MGCKNITIYIRRGIPIYCLRVFETAHVCLINSHSSISPITMESVMDQVRITLNKELADRLVALRASSRSNLFELAVLAADIRREHLHMTTKKYVASFRTFWREQDMERRFGSLPNFTKYAEAGDAVRAVTKNDPALIERMPTSLRSLYEISQLRATELELCLEDTFHRDEETDDPSKWRREGDEPQPLINPASTEAEIRAWRERWRNPGSMTEVTASDLMRVKLDAALLGSDGRLLEAERKRVNGLCEALQKTLEAFGDRAFTIELDKKVFSSASAQDGEKLTPKEMIEKASMMEARQLEDFYLWLDRQTGDFLNISPSQASKMRIVADYFSETSFADK